MQITESSTTPAVKNENSFATNTKTSTAESLAARVMVLVSQKNYDEAARLLRTAPPSRWTSNTLGVCLLRCGRIDEALKVYRSLVLTPGTTIIRPEVDDLTRINFATALMMSGTPSGALEVLAQLQSPKMEPAVRIRNAITDWSNSLSLLRRWEWRFNRIDPPRSYIPIDFEPGEFTFTVRR